MSACGMLDGLVRQRLYLLERGVGAWPRRWGDDEDKVLGFCCELEGVWDVLRKVGLKENAGERYLDRLFGVLNLMEEKCTDGVKAGAIWVGEWFTVGEYIGKCKGEIEGFVKGETAILR